MAGVANDPFFKLSLAVINKELVSLFDADFDRISSDLANWRSWQEVHIFFGYSAKGEDFMRKEDMLNVMAHIEIACL